MHDSYQSGFSVVGPTDGRSPLVFASPHSGRDYPRAFVAAAQLSVAQLRRAEDAMVDMLLDGIDCAPVLRARYARTYLDLNRAADEIDAEMFDGALTVPARITDRVTAGLGVLPRLATQGQNIYGRKLHPGEAASRIATLHRPWHTRIATLTDRARAQHGHAILIDCHSMPTPMGIRPPQIVIGDRFGTSAAPMLVDFIDNYFARLGWRVARNAPYAGGYTTETHGRPVAGIHAVQIEIDRALYMDTVTMTRTRDFSRIANAMTTLAQLLVVAAPKLRLAPPLQEAAE
jgi:N-formylglutamate deformylase